MGGGLPAICREPAAKPALAVCQMQPGPAAQAIAAVVTSESFHALRAEAGVRISVNYKVFDKGRFVRERGGYSR